MGLAAKLAAAGGAAYAYDQYSQQQQPQQQQQLAPQQAYYAPPPLQHQPADNSALHALLTQKLQNIVASNQLHTFYSAQALQAVLARLMQVDFRAIAARWNMPVELALDFATLALYDIVVYADDSASMRFAENGTRIDDLKAILARVTEVATLFDTDGISIRAMNHPAQGDHITTPAQAAAFADQLTFNGATPMGTELERRITKPLFEKPIKARTLRKPLLVITITDGEPTGESEGKVRHEIKDAKKAASRSAYGPGAIAFEFAQVGKDRAAQAFLAKLDNDKDVGKMVDCTSYYELEQLEYQKKGINLTPDLWMMKLMVGAVDRTYDEQD